ncbi:MAG: isoprenylcysteine carboxylmethyltransferase family protein, partial [Phycisphaerales bacterium]
LVLVLSSFLAARYYIKSVSPAQLERRIGGIAYQKCGKYRIFSCLFMVLLMGNYVACHFFPLPIPLPGHFPWGWYVSLAAAVVIALPSVTLMLWGIRDAGKETLVPQRDGCLYGGIYRYIRHPQVFGELALLLAIALLLDSPFLALLTFVYIPLWAYICIAEEKDLVVRYGRAYEEYRNRTGFWIPRTSTSNAKSDSVNDLTKAEGSNEETRRNQHR